jgi:hypothetical protein
MGSGGYDCPQGSLSCYVRRKYASGGYPREECMVIFFGQATVTTKKVGDVEPASGGMSQVGQRKDPNLAYFLERK